MDAPMGSLAEDAGSSLSAAPGQAEPPAPAADPERVANQAFLPTSIPNPDTVRVCSYGDHCRVAVVGGPQLSSCGEPGCINSLHHLCQGEYEAKFSELFANCDMLTRTLRLHPFSPLPSHRARQAPQGHYHNQGH
eukprot:jgi/Tetstr1/462651/TSEL_007634.t2